MLMQLLRRCGRPYFLLLILLCVFWPENPAHAGTASAAPPTIVFMTDFGVADDSVAICKGVMYSIAPELRIVETWTVFRAAR
jgi:hypothetical protein